MASAEDRIRMQQQAALRLRSAVRRVGRVLAPSYAAPAGPRQTQVAGPTIATTSWVQPGGRFNIQGFALSEVIRFQIEGFRSFVVTAQVQDTGPTTAGVSSIVRVVVLLSTSANAHTVIYQNVSILNEPTSWTFSGVGDQLVIKAGLTANLAVGGTPSVPVDLLLTARAIA